MKTRLQAGTVELKSCRTSCPEQRAPLGGERLNFAALGYAMRIGRGLPGTHQAHEVAVCGAFNARPGLGQAVRLRVSGGELDAIPMHERYQRAAIEQRERRNHLPSGGVSERGCRYIFGQTLGAY